MNAANANRLRELREQAKLELYDIAVIVRRSPAQVSRYETGDTPVPAHVMRVLAEHYGVTVEHLMGWEKEAA